MGVSFEYTAGETLQQNGMAESAFATLYKKDQALPNGLLFLTSTAMKCGLNVLKWLQKLAA